jgi:hypothetical protein
MEWIWVALAIVIATVGTWLIAKYKLSGPITDASGKIGKIANAFAELYKTIMEALVPEPDGSVVLSPEEVTKIKDALKALAALFGVVIPLGK